MCVSYSQPGVVFIAYTRPPFQLWFSLRMIACHSSCGLHDACHSSCNDRNILLFCQGINFDLFLLKSSNIQITSPDPILIKKKEVMWSIVTFSVPACCRINATEVILTCEYNLYITISINKQTIGRNSYQTTPTKREHALYSGYTLHDTQTNGRNDRPVYYIQDYML